MRKITIVGAGQFGLHLGIGLRRKGFDVTIVTNRTGEQIRKGPILSSQILFGPVLQMEERLGLNPWAKEGGHAAAANFSVAWGTGASPMLGWRHPVQHVVGGVLGKLGKPLMAWDHALPGPGGQSVDQRLKMPVWMDIFEKEGGRLVIDQVDVGKLETLAKDCDLLIVSAGKGEISALFDRDHEKCTFERPQRHLAMVYVHGLKPCGSGVPSACYSIIPGIGEYVTFPCLTLSGPCDILMFESQFDGAMHEMMKGAKSANEVLAAGLKILKSFVPWEADRCDDLTIADPLASLSGAVTPIVRKPIAKLPSGRAILGGGDVVVLNDPLTGQGSNNASKHANVILQAIIDQGDAPFDQAFMQRTFDTHWQSAKWVCRFTNFMLSTEPAEPLPTLMNSATQRSRLREAFLGGFFDASVYANWLFDPKEAKRKIATCTGAPQPREPISKREHPTKSASSRIGMAARPASNS